MGNIKIMYAKYNNVNGKNVSIQIHMNGQILSVPLEEDNTDYQEYLKWVAEGNTPEEADV